MGQQQLLLIVLGVIIIGVAIIVGVNYFTASAADTKRNLLIGECANLASLAQQYYLRPSALGGGSRKFTGWKIPPSLVSTSNGSFASTVFADSVVLIATGNEVTTGSDSIKVRMSVYPSNYMASVIN